MRFPWRNKQVSNLFLAVPETVQYCPQCADVFGVARGDGKRCGCANSEGIEPYRGDLDYGFEICRYCQAEVISTGSRWSTFFCEHCRPLVLRINDSLDARGLVSLPIGRHSLMHGYWLHARPFTAAEIVSDWSAARLRSGWGTYGGGLEPAPWAGFGRYQREVRESEHHRALQQVAALVQDAEPDFLLAALREANVDLASRRQDNRQRQRRSI